MKTVYLDNDNNSNTYNNGAEASSNLLIDNKPGHSLLQCNAHLAKSYNVLKSTPLEHKDLFYKRVLSRNGIVHDPRSQSLPNSLGDSKSDGNADVTDNCDINSKLLSDHDSPTISPTNDFWFRTWPECCDKIKTDVIVESLSNKVSNTHPLTTAGNGFVNSKLSLNEALQNISLAYSPITKQLHLLPVDKCTDNDLPTKDLNPNVTSKDTVDISKKLGHRRTEAGSFSSTVSSLSDPSPSGSLLGTDEQSSSIKNDTKEKKRSLTEFFNR